MSENDDELAWLMDDLLDAMLDLKWATMADDEDLMEAYHEDVRYLIDEVTDYDL